jgi:hypothetical protein
LRVDHFELAFVGGMGIEPAGAGRHAFERDFVQGILACRARVADRHGMDHDALVAGDLRRLVRRHLARRVIAVGEGDQHPLAHRAAFEHIDGQTEGVAESGLRSRHADLGFAQQLAADIEILGERRLHEGRAAEENQPDAVALAPRQKLIEHRFHRAESVLWLSAGIREVAGRHRSGQVHR